MIYWKNDISRQKNLNSNAQEKVIFKPQVCQKIKLHSPACLYDIRCCKLIDRHSHLLWAPDKEGKCSICLQNCYGKWESLNKWHTFKMSFGTPTVIQESREIQRFCFFVCLLLLLFFVSLFSFSFFCCCCFFFRLESNVKSSTVGQTTNEPMHNGRTTVQTTQEAGNKRWYHSKERNCFPLIFQ